MKSILNLQWELQGRVEWELLQMVESCLEEIQTLLQRKPFILQSSSLFGSLSPVVSSFTMREYSENRSWLLVLREGKRHSHAPIKMEQRTALSFMKASLKT